MDDFDKTVADAVLVAHEALADFRAGPREMSLAAAVLALDKERKRRDTIADLGIAVEATVEKLEGLAEPDAPTAGEELLEELAELASPAPPEVKR